MRNARAELHVFVNVLTPRARFACDLQGFGTFNEKFIFSARLRRAALVHATKQRYLQHFSHFQKCVHRPHGIDVFRKRVHLPHGIAVFAMEMWFLVRAGFHG